MDDWKPINEVLGVSVPGQATAAVGKSGKGKKVAIIAGIVVLVAGLGAAGYFFLYPMLKGDSEGEGTGEDKESTSNPAPPDMDIIKAASEGNLDALKQHIAAGTDLNQRTSDGQKTTPLIAATGVGQAEAVKVLIEAKADLNLQNKDGSTALHTAAFLCHPEIVEALLKAGADKAIKTNTGATALDGALAPWDQVKPIYDYLNRELYKPAGIPLDYNRIQQTRPKIAELLR